MYRREAWSGKSQFMGLPDKLMLYVGGAIGKSSWEGCYIYDMVNDSHECRGNEPDADSTHSRICPPSPLLGLHGCMVRPLDDVDDSSRIGSVRSWGRKFSEHEGGI